MCVQPRCRANAASRPTINARPNSRARPFNPRPCARPIDARQRSHPAGEDRAISAAACASFRVLNGARYSVCAFASAAQLCDMIRACGGRVETRSGVTPCLANARNSRQKKMWVCPGNSGTRYPIFAIRRPQASFRGSLMDCTRTGFLPRAALAKRTQPMRLRSHPAYARMR